MLSDQKRKLVNFSKQTVKKKKPAYIQLKSYQTTWLLNKPYVKEVILRG